MTNIDLIVALLYGRDIKYDHIQPDLEMNSGLSRTSFGNDSCDFVFSVF